MMNLMIIKLVVPSISQASLWYVISVDGLIFSLFLWFIWMKIKITTFCLYMKTITFGSPRSKVFSCRQMTSWWSQKMESQPFLWKHMIRTDASWIKMARIGCFTPWNSVTTWKHIHRTIWYFNIRIMIKKQSLKSRNSIKARSFGTPILMTSTEFWSSKWAFQNCSCSRVSSVARRNLR